MVSDSTLIKDAYFYPHQSMEKVEEGDLGHHTPLAIPKKVEWMTDQYGWRNRPWTGPVDVVLVGDSFMVGSGLDQKDTLAEELARSTGLRVVTVSPHDLSYYLRIEEFIEHPPKWVLYSRVERSVLGASPLEFKGDRIQPMEESLFLSWKCAFDKMIKNNFSRYVYARLEQNFHGALHALNPLTTERVGHGYYDEIYLNRGFRYSAQKDVIFYSGIRANHPVSQEKVSEIIGHVKTYDAIIKSRGSQFLFMPTPNKESVYSSWLEPVTTNTFLEDLCHGLKEEGISHIDLKTLFLSHLSGPMLYQKDDTHWSKEGVRLAAEQIRMLISER